MSSKVPISKKKLSRILIDTFAPIPAPRSSIKASGEQVPRIGIVSENPDLIARTSKQLEQGGYRTVAIDVSSGASASLIERAAPDSVLIDSAIAGGNVFELCGELRATDWGHQLPIMVISEAIAPEEVVARSLICGADDFCVSSELGAELLARLRVQHRHRRDREMLRAVQRERDKYRLASNLDPLTGILNRRCIDDVVGRAIADGNPFGILFIDVDHFKSINDRFGHDQGDTVLKLVAKCMARQTRPSDFAGRYGGEEFIIIAMGVTLETAPIVSERHRAAIEALIIPSARLTASVGVATFDPAAPDPTPEALYRRADAAVYEAKRLGRNRVIIARPMKPQSASDATPSSDAGELEKALVAALQTGRAGLPLLPEAARDALRLARDPDCDLGSVSKLVDRDPPLAARFLALANSSVYGRGYRVASTRAALMRLGLMTARDLLLQVALERSRSGLKSYQREVELSFKHSLVTAVAATEAARLLGANLEDAYLCGLLHDIGESRIYRILADTDITQPPDLVASLVGKYHGVSGAQLARAWSLPDTVALTCEHHHDPAHAHETPVQVVMIADWVADHVIHNRIGSMPPPPEHIPEWAVREVAAAIGPRLPEISGACPPSEKPIVPSIRMASG